MIPSRDPHATDSLKDCPMGMCPWCHVAVDDCLILDGSWHGNEKPTCGYDEDLSVSANRARYLREKEAGAGRKS